MQPNEYQALTKETEIYSNAAREFMAYTIAAETIGDAELVSNLSTILQLMYCTGKLNGEAGETAERVFKLFRDGQDNRWNIRPEIKTLLFKELGDVLWYVARISDLLGFTLESVMEGNIHKLMDRKERGVLSGSGDER